MKTAAYYKAEETKRKAEMGLKRRSFWLTEAEIRIIENFKQQHSLKTNDEAVQKIIRGEHD